jgi:hypothetical protein
MSFTQTRYHFPVSHSSFSILSNQPPLDHESFAAHRELESILKKNIRGEVRFDLGSRALYATDSSNYRQLPVGVVFPRDASAQASHEGIRQMARCSRTIYGHRRNRGAWDWDWLRRERWQWGRRNTGG